MEGLVSKTGGGSRPALYLGKWGRRVGIAVWGNSSGWGGRERLETKGGRSAVAFGEEGAKRLPHRFWGWFFARGSGVVRKN